MGLESDEWELVNDNGFVYKRKRRRLDPDPAASAPVPDGDSGEEERRRRGGKRSALLKLKEKYGMEISLWEHLTGALTMMEQMGNEKREERGMPMVKNGGDETAADEDQDSSALDEVLSQVEAQEAMIGNMMNLCDVAEALCDAYEEKTKQSVLNLPIWESPRALLSSLCEV